MALKITIKEVEFGVGDRIKVVQRIKDADKSRESTFEGMVIGIRGREPGKTFLVRRVGEAGIGIERIFPVNLPTIEKIVIVKKGMEGVKRAKIYYTRDQSPSQIEEIYRRTQAKNIVKKSPKSVKTKSLAKKTSKSK